MDNCPVTHAKAYPFRLPEGSYVLDRDGWRPIDGDENAPAFPSDRVAVIASGSNASPDRLADKFAGHADLLESPVFVERARLDDFDAVYSAHISSYGSIPATLAHVPGAVADVFVTWLTEGQLARMHETEAVGVNYDFAKLGGIHLHCETSGAFTSAHAYISKRGCLSHRGQPVPLAATNAKGRQGRAMTQAEVLDYARTLIAPRSDIDIFIRQHIECSDTRAQRTKWLGDIALHHGWPNVTVMAE